MHVGHCRYGEWLYQMGGWVCHGPLLVAGQKQAESISFQRSSSAAGKARHVTGSVVTAVQDTGILWLPLPLPGWIPLDKPEHSHPGGLGFLPSMEELVSFD